MMQKANLRARILEKIIDNAFLQNWEEYKDMFGKEDAEKAFKANIEQISTGIVLDPFHIFALKIKDESAKEHLTGVLNIDPYPNEEILKTVNHLLNMDCKAQVIVSKFFLVNLIKLLELMDDGKEIAIEILKKNDDYLLRLRTKDMDILLSPLSKEKTYLKKRIFSVLYKGVNDNDNHDKQKERGGI